MFVSCGITACAEWVIYYIATEKVMIKSAAFKSKSGMKNLISTMTEVIVISNNIFALQSAL